MNASFIKMVIGVNLEQGLNATWRERVELRASFRQAVIARVNRWLQPLRKSTRCNA
ncbi:MAG: hypothetical protein QXY49_04355 [Thermofilaceae archaeon]